MGVKAFLCLHALLGHSHAYSESRSCSLPFCVSEGANKNICILWWGKVISWLHIEFNIGEVSLIQQQICGLLKRTTNHEPHILHWPAIVYVWPRPRAEVGRGCIQKTAPQIHISKSLFNKDLAARDNVFNKAKQVCLTHSMILTNCGMTEFISDWIHLEN